ASASRSVSVNRSQVLRSASGRLRITFALSASHHSTVPRGSVLYFSTRSGSRSIVKRNLLSRYLLMALPLFFVGSLRVPGEVGLHGVEQVERVHVVGLRVLAGRAHHQHEVHEAVS